MRKLVLLGMVTVFLISCDQQEKRYTQQSPEIDTYKKVIDAYEKQNWQEMGSYYADTAKIMNNALEENAQSLDELIAENKEDANLFSSWDYLDDNSEYEMIVNDKGNTWVNFWGVWQGTMKANDKTYTIPAHITARFVDGKIVEEYGYWDLSRIMMDLQNIKNSPVLNDSTATAMKEEKSPG